MRAPVRYLVVMMAAVLGLLVPPGVAVGHTASSGAVGSASAAAATSDPAGWERLLPGFVAYALDVAADGEIVFVGHEVPTHCEMPQMVQLPEDQWYECLLAIVADERCEAMGCSLYRAVDGAITRVATEDIDEDFDQEERAYGFSDVAVSADGRRVAATALGGQADVGRIWSIRDSAVSRLSTPSPTFAVTDTGEEFLAAAGPARMFRVSGRITAIPTAVSCALYDLSPTRSGAVATGFGGTYRMARDGSATRIGPAGEAVWSDRSGRRVLVAASRPPNTVVITATSDAGRTWVEMPFRDDGSAPGEQFIVTALLRDGSGTVWAVGGSRSTPAAHLWRLDGRAFVRVPGPADGSTGPYTDAVVLPDGRIAVASRVGVYAATA